MNTHYRAGHVIPALQSSSTRSRFIRNALSLALALASSTGFATYDEELIVSASPLDKSHSDNTRPAAVLSGDQLRTQAAATLGETLQGQLGVSTASFGPGVGTPIIRGQQGNRVKVMQDNLDNLDAANASGDHANATEALLADRIEVLRGPQTLRYGSGAIGGIINVIDNRIPDRRLSTTDEAVLEGAVEVRHSSVNDETASLLRLDGGQGALAWHLDGLYRDSANVEIPGTADAHGGEETSDGFIDNSDSQASGGTLGASWIGARGFVGFSINAMENNYGIPPGGHEHHEEEGHEEEDHEEEEETIRIDMQQTRYDLKAGLEQPFAGIDNLRLRLGYVDYEHTELESGIAGTIFDSNALEGRLELVHSPVGNWRGAFGLQALDRDFAAIGEEAFIPATNTQSIGLFVVEELNLERWLLELGARLEHQSIDADTGASESHNSLSLSFASQWRLSEQQHLNLVLSRAQRAPAIEELYSDGAHLAEQIYILGDESLDRETSHNIELGYSFHGNPENYGWEIDINLFYNDIEDFIYRRNTDDELEELPLFVYDQEDATYKGAEAQVRIPLNRLFALRLFGDYVRAQLDRGGDVPRVTPPRVGAELQYEHNDWQAQLRLVEVSDQNHPGDFEEETDGYTRLDLQVHRTFTWRDNSAMVFVKGQNLLDEEIRNAASILRESAPEAGRGFTAGVRFSF